VIRAVTFDAAGTLIVPREPVGETYARIARRFGIAADAEVVEPAFRRAFGAAPPLVFPDVDAVGRPAAERAWWRHVVEAALGAPEPGPAFDACFAALFAHFAGAAAWTVHPDVGPTLAALRARGLGLGVVSNFDGRLPGLLDAFGLAASFDAIVWSSDVGAAKPDPAIFRAAATRLGVEPTELCHVGDDTIADVDGARHAGAMAVLIDRSGATPGSLATLTDLVARLDAPGTPSNV